MNLNEVTLLTGSDWQSYRLNGIEEESIKEFILDDRASNLINIPVILVGIGFLIAVSSGVYFANLMQKKLRSWEKDKVSPLPLGNPQTQLSWAIAFLGLCIFFSGALKILEFGTIISISIAITITIIPASLMWKVISNLLVEVDAGKVKEIDEYF